MSVFILGVDIGNTNTVFGLFDETPEHEILNVWKTVTRPERTSDELGIFLRGFLQSADVNIENIRGFIYSSVVPNFNQIVEQMARDYFHCEAKTVTYESVPLEFEFPRPYEIGADRLVNAVAAHEIFGGDNIVIDLGTATTFCVLHGNVYCGGSIAPGLKMSIESLSKSTAQLPPIELARPPSGVVGDSTIHALQSGFFFGWTGMLREIKEEIERACEERNYRVIATGGLSELFFREIPGIFNVVDSDLTLKGLKIIYKFQK